MVWPAPISRSSGGRSAVNTIIGTPASSPSTIAGWRLAAADPEVQRTAAGAPVARPAPSAKNPALRSSRITVTSIDGSRESATASGVEREPGETAARRTPQRISSSTIAEASAVLRFVGSTTKRVAPRLRLRRTLASNGRSVEPAGRKGLFVDLYPEARAPLVEDQAVALGRDSASDRRREEALGGETVRDTGVPAPGPQSLGRVSRGSDSHRTLQSARQVGRHHIGDFKSGGQPADLGDLDGGDVASTEVPGAARVEWGNQALVSRDRDLDVPPQLHHLLEGPNWLLHQLDVALNHRAQAVRGVGDGPGAVRVHPNSDLRPEGFPDRGHLGHITGQADLELEGSESQGVPLLGELTGGCRVGRRQRRIADHLRRLVRAEQRPDALAGGLSHK